MLNWLSNVAVSETNWRNGNSPTNVPSVDIDDDVKAGHCFDPLSEMQF